MAPEKRTGLMRGEPDESAVAHTPLTIWYSIILHYINEGRSMVILIGGEKGGTGKTTIATNLAALQALAGYDVLLVDTDSQGSASYWASSRNEAGIKPRVACIQKFGKGLQGEIQDLAGRYQDVIIDAGGRDSVELRAAMIIAHKAFVPIQASQFDIWTLGRMNDLAVTAQGFNPDLRTWVVINRGSTNPSVTETAQAGEVLDEFEHLDLATSVIYDRIAYRKATSEGLSVAEMKPADSKAVNEMNAFRLEVFTDGKQAAQ